MNEHSSVSVNGEVEVFAGSQVDVSGVTPQSKKTNVRADTARQRSCRG